MNNNANKTLIFVFALLLCLSAVGSCFALYTIDATPITITLTATPPTTCEHNYTEEITTPATCTNDGEKTFTCSLCNNSYTETIEATGHNFGNNNVCSGCGGSMLYLKPTANWLKASARFAAYFYNSTDITWVDMADSDNDGYYEVIAPAGYTGVIFCRMNPSNTTNNWENKWNQTGDLTINPSTPYNFNCNWYVSKTDLETAESKTLYLLPNKNWYADGARFAAYFYINGTNTNRWVPMTDTDGDGYYEVIIPDGYTSVIFCRMNPNATDNNWNNKWNQTGDLTIPTDGTNCYTLDTDSWDTGKWSTN